MDVVADGCIVDGEHATRIGEPAAHLGACWKHINGVCKRELAEVADHEILFLFLSVDSYADHVALRRKNNFAVVDRVAALDVLDVDLGLVARYCARVEEVSIVLLDLATKLEIVGLEELCRSANASNHECDDEEKLRTTLILHICECRP